MKRDDEDKKEKLMNQGIISRWTGGWLSGGKLLGKHDGTNRLDKDGNPIINEKNSKVEDINDFIDLGSEHNNISDSLSSDAPAIPSNNDLSGPTPSNREKPIVPESKNNINNEHKIANKGRPLPVPPTKNNANIEQEKQKSDAPPPLPPRPNTGIGAPGLAGMDALRPLPPRPNRPLPAKAQVEIQAEVQSNEQEKKSLASLFTDKFKGKEEETKALEDKFEQEKTKKAAISNHSEDDWGYDPEADHNKAELLHLREKAQSEQAAAKVEAEARAIRVAKEQAAAKVEAEAKAARGEVESIKNNVSPDENEIKEDLNKGLLKYRELYGGKNKKSHVEKLNDSWNNSKNSEKGGRT